MPKPALTFDDVFDEGAPSPTSAPSRASKPALTFDDVFDAAPEPTPMPRQRPMEAPQAEVQPDIPMPQPRPSEAPQLDAAEIPMPRSRPVEAAQPAPSPPDLPYPDVLGVEPAPFAGNEPPQVSVSPAITDRAERKGLPAEDSITDYPTEFVKSFGEGAKNLPASALRGYGAAAPALAQRQIETLDKISAPLNPQEEDPFERAAYRARRSVHPPPEVVEQRRAGLVQTANTPISEQPLYRAGRAIEDFGKDALGAKPGWENSWTRGIGGGFGSMTAGVLTSMIPYAGPTTAATIFLGAGMGEAVDNAVKNGATEAQARKAAEFGAIAGATDMVDTLLPMLGSTGKAMAFIKRVGTRTIYGALTEGGQEGVQQLIQNVIAKGIYKPDQDLMEDVPRSAAIGMIVGGVTSGGVSAIEGRGERRPTVNQTTVDDFLRTADEVEARQRGARTREEIDEFIRQKEARATASEQRPGQAALPAPDQGGQAQTPPPQAAPPGPEQTAGSPEVDLNVNKPADPDDVLRDFGFSDAQIAAMSPQEKAGWAQGAGDIGVGRPPVAPQQNQAGTAAGELKPDLNGIKTPENAPAPTPPAPEALPGKPSKPSKPALTFEEAFEPEPPSSTHIKSEPAADGAPQQQPGEGIPKPTHAQRAFQAALEDRNGGRATANGWSSTVYEKTRGKFHYELRRQDGGVSESVAYPTRQDAVAAAVDRVFNGPGPEKKPVTPQIVPEKKPAEPGTKYVLPSFVTAPHAKPKKGGKPAKVASDWTQVGKNNIGQTLYEDQNGVRSYIENGVRTTEAVPMIPTRGGVVAVPNPEHDDQFKTHDEIQNALMLEAADSLTPEVLEGVDQQEVQDALEQANQSQAGEQPGEGGQDKSVDEVPQAGVEQPEGGQRPSVKAGQVSETAAGGEREPDESGRPEAGERPAEQPAEVAPQIALARKLAADLAKGRSPTWRSLQIDATEAYGGKLSEGAFDRKAMYDALELAVNMRVREDASLKVGTGDSWQRPTKNLEKLLSELPTQTVRSEEQEAFQQFSTPPHYAMAVAYAAGIRDGDSILEPSAGTGSLIAAAWGVPDTTKTANELAPARAALLRELVGKDGKVFTENAEQIANILPKKGVHPTVVVMNPPFSQTAGRLGDKKDLMTGANHIMQGLQMLQPGGRLVAIVGRGMSLEAPRFRDWWKGVREKYDVKANIAVQPSVYEKYGTKFGTRLLVIDKVPPTGKAPLDVFVESLPELMTALEDIRNARPATPRTEQHAAEPSSPQVAETGEGGGPGVQPAPSQSPGVGVGASGGGRNPGQGSVQGGGASPSNVRVETAGGNDLALVQPERGRGDDQSPNVAAGGKEPEGSSSNAPGPSLQPNAKPTPGASTGGERELATHDEAIRSIATLTQGSEPKIAASIARGDSDTQLIDVTSRAGWGGSYGGTSLPGLFVDARGKVVTIKDANGERVYKGKELAEAIRRLFGPAIKPANERVELETSAKPGKQTGAISENLYEAYEPQRVRVKGAAKHPGPLVESAAMASVTPPVPSYQPSLPKKIISDGLLSLPQLEAVTYAGQAHEQMLPAAEGAAPRRKGFFIGDGTGVGKGREIAGIILDNLQQGRKKAVWVSEKRKLLNDAQRDWKGLGQNPNQIFQLGKVKPGDPIKGDQGIGFITYDTLKGGMSDQAALARTGFAKGQRVVVGNVGGVVQRVKMESRGEATVTVKLEDGTIRIAKASEVKSIEGETASLQTRIDQIASWLGEDFDGVIAFDEAHNMANAVGTVDKGRKKDAAQKAIAGLALQERLPNARIVYVSATGATEVSNLAYAERLGLWGRGTPFSSRNDFVSQVEGGGIAAMELIARDMKQLGLYMARNLSYDDGTKNGRVEYSKLEHKLTKDQREIYDTSAEAWQIVLQNMQAVMAQTGADKNWRARAAVSSAFWGAHQRFFNQIITSLQMPSVTKAIEKDLAEGRQVVLQLTNTNEASQERAAARAETAEDIEDLDITPRDQIIQLVQTAFPTQQYQEQVDPNTGAVTSVPVVDSEGKPVENAAAVEARDALIERLASIRVPQGPLDLILDTFGSDVVAEVTGRGRRFVLKTDEKTGERKRVEESRPASANQAETDAFQAGKKKILVFSNAGGTGSSYHADNTAASKNARRVHYLLQAGWEAAKAVQGFGRTHRTNQASAPIFTLVSTDLDGQKRFISSIARRLAQLGALTKGQRQAGDQGVFTARDNLESTEARMALRQFWTDLQNDRAPGIDPADFEKQTGLALFQMSSDGRRGAPTPPPEIQQFLNRLLSLKVKQQNEVFQAFSARLDGVIDSRAQAGVLDKGLETVRADRIVKDSEQIVHTDAASGAETKYAKLTLYNKFKGHAFADVADSAARPVKFWAKSPRGRVYAVADAPHYTDDTGNIVSQYRLIGPSSGRLEKYGTIEGYQSKWEKIEREDAAKLWRDELEKAPEYTQQDLHLITGAILPIWDRLRGSPRIVRLQTDEGERFLGRTVPNEMISTTLTALGAEMKGKEIAPAQLFSHLIAGGRAKLANGWTLKRSLVAGEDRIELIGPQSWSEGQEVKQDGVFTEKIAYNVRYFVPTGNDGPAVLERLTKTRPVVETTGGRTEAAEQVRRRPVVESVSRLTPAAAKRQNDIAHMISDILGPIVGNNGLRVQLRHDLGPSIDKGWGSYANKDPNLYEATVQGRYHAYERLLQLSLHAEDIRGTAYHEAYHDIEAYLLTDREQEFMLRETERMRQYVFRHDQGKQYQPSDIRGMAGYEIRAEAFRIFSQEREQGGRPRGLHMVITRFFERLFQALRAIRNGLAGYGFKTYKDVFNRAHAGEFAGRKPKLREGVFESAEALSPQNEWDLLRNRMSIRERMLAAEQQERQEQRKPAEKNGSAGVVEDLRRKGSVPPVPPMPTSTPTPTGPGKIRLAAERLLDLTNEVGMAVAPMGQGSDQAKAEVKDYANNVRLARHMWGKRDELLAKRFTPDQRKRMWDAADAESVAIQKGEASPADGLSSLNPEERRTVETLQREARQAYETAKAVGIIDEEAEGLPSYTPRMMVGVARGFIREADTGDRGEGASFFFRTSTPQMKHRKHLTAEETEAAMKARFGEGAHIARDIRALALATGKLHEAIAGKVLINRIKEITRLAGQEDVVVEGGEPTRGGYFTLNHPSFKTWKPKLRKNEATGRWEQAKWPDGSLAFERVPIYIRNDWKGPLSAVLQDNGGNIYRAAMALKGKAMSVVMYSPAIHNVVEWSRALPAYPLKVFSGLVYFTGNKAKNDPTQMRAAIRAGMVPIGKRYFNQDITSIMEDPSIAPGRSWTAKVLGAVPGLFDPRAGNAVKRAVDKAGDVWHNTLLWDRIGDLQMGLYVYMRRDLVRKGWDVQTAERVAAHFANRYAGALPIEAMSAAARKIANVLMFSRTFTLGNMGAMKDAIRGLPRDVQAQILRDAGPEALKKAKSFSRRKSQSIIILDIVLGMIATSLLADYFKWWRDERDVPELVADYYHRFIELAQEIKDKPTTLLHPFNTLWKLSSTADNEPGKDIAEKARVLLWYDNKGRGIYGRNPVGKIGEEFMMWPTAPGDMVLRKLSTFAKPVVNVLANDKYFGSGFDKPARIWRPDPEGVEWIKNAGRIGLHFLEAQVPAEMLRGAYDLAIGGEKDPWTNAAKMAGPLVGISVSQGHPGGAAGGIKAQKRRERELDRYFNK